MAQGRGASFKLSITNLVLVNQVYPFDFFLRIRTPNSQDYQDSPLIKANQDECEEVFPWEFAVSKSQLRIEFIQISKSTRVEIQRGQLIIESVTDEDGQTVAMLANRTAKKLCLLTYTLQTYRAPAQNEKGVSSLETEQVCEEPELSKIKPSKLVLTKQHQELSRQISQINKSIDKILSHEKNEHAIFNKYLDESTSFIREIMSSRLHQEKPKDEGDEAQQPSQFLKQIQEDEPNESQSVSQVSAIGQPSSKKWYEENFNRQQPQILSNKNFRQSESKGKQPEIVIVDAKSPEPGQETLFLSEISFNTETKPNCLSFLEPTDKAELLKAQVQNGSSFHWKRTIELPYIPAFVVVATDQLKRELKGCIARKQLDKGRVFLFGQKGQQKGLMMFKHKVLGVYSVQTQPLLDFESQTPDLNQMTSEKDKEVEQKKIVQEKESKDDQNVETYKLAKSVPSSNRGSKLSQRSELKKSSARRKTEKKQMENKEDLKSPKIKRCELVSNSVEMSYLPFLKRGSAIENVPQRTSFMSDNELSSVSSSQFLSRIKMTNLKIDSISAKLHKDSHEFLGKFIKLTMRNKQPIVTETINLSQNLTWKGKGYIFNNVSPYAELKIELCNDESGREAVVGKAKVCLALLNLQKENSVQFYHEFLRDDNQEQVGELVLGYESVEKNRRSYSAQRYDDDGLYEQQTLEKKAKRRPKLKARSKEKAKIGLIDSEPTNRTQKKNAKPSGHHPKSIMSGASAIRSKKYTGGNIIIGRAARFKVNQNPGKPGPGDYEVPSAFEKHVGPT